MARVTFSFRPFQLLKRFLPQTLYGRAVLIIVTPLVVVQMITTYVFLDRHWDSVSRLLADNIAGDIGIIVTLLEENSPNLPPEKIVYLAERRFDFKISFPLSFHMRPFLAEEDPSQEFLKEALGHHLKYPFTLLSEERTLLIYVQLPSYPLLIEISRKKLFSKTTPLVLMWTIGSSVILFFIALIFMRNQIRPLRRLAIAAEKFGKGLEVEDFKPGGSFEVRKAGAAFMIMKERIQKQIAQRTEMLAGVSHDLRTILARMKLEVALQGDTGETEGLKSDIQDMEKILGAYLDFAKGEGSESPIVFNLAEAIKEWIESLKFQRDQIEFISDPTIIVLMRRIALQRCFMNLLTNAQRYATYIRIELIKENGNIVLYIDDNGPGIPENERLAVFQPFYRLELERPLEGGNSGLGLTIAKDIIQSHGGEIYLSSSPLKGLRIHIILPL